MHCYPCFDDMDFFEFIVKYEKLKNKVESEKKDRNVDLIENFKKFFPRNT